jgi:dTMP kinase
MRTLSESWCRSVHRSASSRPWPGALITFCGLDGSGKTTQARLLADRLRPERRTAVVRSITAAQGSDPVVRAYLDGKVAAADAEDVLTDVALLTAADRVRQFRSVIRPMLSRGDVVIVDRYVYSAYAWAVARGFHDLDWLLALNRYLPDPDLGVVLDIDPSTSVRRIVGRGDVPRWEEEDLDRLGRVRQAMLTHPWGPAATYRILDGTQPLDTLADQISDLAERVLSARQAVSHR